MYPHLTLHPADHSHLLPCPASHPRPLTATPTPQTCPVPVTCKIRVFPDPAKTLAYARMIERSGCCLLAVHGRTREQRDTAATRADWDQIRAVKQALSIPVLANGNVRNLADADACMAYTGCDGVMSAESLLVDPALFDPRRLQPGVRGELGWVTAWASCACVLVVLLWHYCSV